MGVLFPQWLHWSLELFSSSLPLLLNSPLSSPFPPALTTLPNPPWFGPWAVAESTLAWHLRKWQAFSVGIIITLAPHSCSLRASSGTLIVATLPVQPKSTLGPVLGGGNHDIICKDATGLRVSSLVYLSSILKLKKCLFIPQLCKVKIG